MVIVSFFAVRMVDTIDSTETSVQTIKEVQASQGEIIKGLQRDRDNADKEIEKLKNQVDRLKEDNAVLKGKLNVSSPLDTSKAASGQLFFVSASFVQRLSISGFQPDDAGSNPAGCSKSQNQALLRLPEIKGQP